MGNQLSSDDDGGNIVMTPGGIIESAPRYPVVSQLSSMDSYWYPEEGQPGWRIPVKMPPDTPRASNSKAATVKGLKCSDIKRIPSDSRRRVCSSTFGYVPNVDITSFKGIQSNNTPIGFAQIADTPVAFITGQNACPRQCGDLSKTNTVTDALVKWDPQASAGEEYALLTRDSDGSQQWANFPTMRDLQSSPEYAKMMRDSPSNFASALWATLRQLQEERKHFAGRSQEERERSDRELWAAASELAVDDIPIATEAARIAEQTLKQQVLCVEQDGDIPDNWASMERYPAQVIDPGKAAGLVPTTCEVQTKTTSPLGDTAVTTAVVPKSEVQNELSTQARAMVDAFSPDSIASKTADANQQAEMDMLINALAPGTGVVPDTITTPIAPVLVKAFAPKGAH